MNIVVLDAYTANPGDLSWNALKSLGNVILYDRTPPSETASRARDAEIVLTNKVILDAPTLDNLPKLKYVGVLATGTNVVDCAHARERGVVVTNIPQYSTESVVQATMAHLFNIASSYVANVNSTRNGEWCSCADFSYTTGPLVELSGKRLGIVGYGTIGKRVAQVAIALGMNVVAYGPRLALGKRSDGVEAVALEQLFQTCDVVSLHCPLTEATRFLVNAERISSMKKGSWLINTGRGPLLDEQAVANALRSGQLGAVGLDVLSTEPPAPTNPLLSAPNCYITPHNAWASFEARQRLITIAVDNIKAFLENHPQNVVN